MISGVVGLAIGCTLHTPITSPSPPALTPLLATSSPSPSPFATQALSTLTPPPTLPPTATSSTPADLVEVLREVKDALSHQRAEALVGVIGDQGVAFAPFAVGATPPGYNNAPEIIAPIRQALQAGTPTCLGYNPEYGESPQKALLVLGDLALDWEALSLSGRGVVATGLIFYRRAAGWELTFIVPLPEWAWPDLQATLRPCP